MTTPTIDLSVRPVVDVLLACLEQEIARVETPPQVVCLRPGASVELLMSTVRDECCEGLAWVRVATIYPSSNFPTPDSEPTKCSPYQYAAVLEMGVARCAPTPGAEDIPSCEEWTDVTYAVLDDAAAMRRAVCCFTAIEKPRLVVVGTWQPAPTEGGCVGGSMTVTVAVGDCDCVEDS
jgi:hypothetical protein